MTSCVIQNIRSCFIYLKLLLQQPKGILSPRLTRERQQWYTTPVQINVMQTDCSELM